MKTPWPSTRDTQCHDQHKGLLTPWNGIDRWLNQRVDSASLTLNVKTLPDVRDLLLTPGRFLARTPSRASEKTVHSNKQQWPLPPFHGLSESTMEQVNHQTMTSRPGSRSEGSLIRSNARAQHRAASRSMSPTGSRTISPTGSRTISPPGSRTILSTSSHAEWQHTIFSPKRPPPSGRFVGSDHSSYYDCVSRLGGAPVLILSLHRRLSLGR